MKNRMLFAAMAAMASGCATTGDLPDLTVGELTVTPAASSPGGQVTITSDIVNLGHGEVVSGDGVVLPTSMDIQIFSHFDDYDPLAFLTSWGPSAEAPIGAGGAAFNTTTIATPTVLAAGGYYICGDVDSADRVYESNENNNRSCVAFTILDGPVAKPDLIIESVRAVRAVEASYEVVIRVKNAGVSAAEIFPVLAFRRAPREPILLTTCPLTSAQRAVGGQPPCPGVATVEPLAPGAVAEWTAYVTFPYAGAMPTNPLPSRTRPQKPHSETVDFMADGCFAPLDPAPPSPYCRIDEIDELNNFAEKTVIVPR
ncbi:MAG: CARDB domain-containing protein [Parvularculaceae bacterium]